jgi:hypothetical protein
LVAIVLKPAPRTNNHLLRETSNSGCCCRERAHRNYTQPSHNRLY